MEDHKETILAICQKKLDLNAPLLSTRRPCSSAPASKLQGISWDNSNRVPFSWEQIPGKPKDMETSSNHSRHHLHHHRLPPLSLPPGRRLSGKDASYATLEGHIDQRCDFDDGLEGDIDDDHGKDGDIDCDVLDIFSLSESVDMVATTWDRRRMQGFSDAANSDDIEPFHQSPNFMIERFLEDAKALAAVSASSSNMADDTRNSCRKYKQKHKHSSTCSSGAVTVRSTFSLSKASCGLDFFLPWRMRPKMCGAESPLPAPAASLRIKSSWDDSAKGNHKFSFAKRPRWPRIDR